MRMTHKVRGHFANYVIFYQPTCIGGVVYGTVWVKVHLLYMYPEDLENMPETNN